MTLSAYQRVVIKVGSSLLLDAETGEVRRDWLMSLAHDVANLREAGKEVVLVSSGAVGLGRTYLDSVADGSLKLEEKQAAAACGQPALMQVYSSTFDAQETSVKTAQILLTIEDSDNRRRYLNARNTLETLLTNHVLPIVNENDTVATSQIRMGDNDRLAARVAQMIGADALVLLSDVDGLYSTNPYENSLAEHVAVVDEITEDVEAMAGEAGSDVGTGGMVTKIAAAKIAAAFGCETIIADGRKPQPLQAVMDGAKHTVFRAKTNPRSARKEWLAHGLNVVGEVVVDAGAAKALLEENSLLPVGVVRVSGEFTRGDAVRILNEAGVEIARGLTAYNSEDAARIAGKNQEEIADLLQYEGRTALVDRADLVVTATS